MIQSIETYKNPTMTQTTKIIPLELQTETISPTQSYRTVARRTFDETRFLQAGYVLNYDQNVI